MTKLYAVVDTNVLVSALISRYDDSAPRKVFRAMIAGDFIPLYHQDILAEYKEVLLRPKFHLEKKTVLSVIEAIKLYGREVDPRKTEEILVDPDDLIFYEVAMEKREDGAYLVTGNMKHYPARHFIVTPSEMVEVLETHHHAR